LKILGPVWIHTVGLTISKPVDQHSEMDWTKANCWAGARRTRELWRRDSYAPWASQSRVWPKAPGATAPLGLGDEEARSRGGAV
jgi:hypothetical protein